MSYPIINEAVALMGVLGLTGNVIPMHWYKVFLHKNGKPHHTAITILADIIYWYRPTHNRCEKSGQYLPPTQKFKGDFLQRSYEDFAECYGYSRKQVRDATNLLESRGLINKHFRTIQYGKSKCSIASNVLFIELIYEKVRELQLFNTLLPCREGGSFHTGKEGHFIQGNTYTETTTETTNNAAAAREARDSEILRSAEAVDPAVAEYQNRCRTQEESSSGQNLKLPIQACSPTPQSAPQDKVRSKPKPEDRAEGYLNAHSEETSISPPSCEVTTPEMPAGGKYERFRNLLPIWRAAALEAGFSDAQSEKLLSEAIKADYDPIPVFSAIKEDKKGKYSNPYGLVITAIARREDYTRKQKAAKQKAAAKKSRKAGPGARRAEAKPIENPKKSAGILSKHLSKIDEMKKAVKEFEQENKR